MQIVCKWFLTKFTKMNKQVFISIVLDTRREKANKKYPVKLRVFTSQPRIQKLYPTKFEFTKNEFTSIWGTLKTRNEHKEIKRELQAIETKAINIIKELNTFTFEQFEKKLFRKIGEGENIFYQYQIIIEELKKKKRIGTASNYELSLKSIKAFINYKTGKEPKQLFFVEVTTKFLNDYENYMIKAKERSSTTVGMYLRPLRAVFNSAISNKEITNEIYPFGIKKYVIPTGESVKKALSKDELKKLFEAKPLTPEQQRAKDFWFFSYSCNGMNIKDIAILKYKNLYDDKFEYLRAKTIITTKKKPKKIVIYLNKYTKSIIKKYANKNKEPNNFIFPILNDNQTELEMFNKIKNFTRFVNQNLKKLAISVELTSDISTYWARHTFSTLAIRGGATMEFVSEALNHSNIKTTQNYFDGFDDETKKEFAQTLMNF